MHDTGSPSSLIQPELIRLGCQPADKEAAIRLAGQLLADAGCIDPAYIDSLLRREAVANTFLGNGLAIPHGMVEDRQLIRRTGIAIVQIPDGLEWNPGQRTRLLFAIAAQSDEHITLLRRLTRLLQDEARLEQLFTAAEPARVLALLEEDAPPAAVDAAADLAERAQWIVDYPNGLHARPAAQWVEAARRHAAQLQVRHGQDAADAKNLISLLQLGLRHGDTVTVSAQGPDAAAALSGLLAAMRDASAQEQTDAALAAQKAQLLAAQQGWTPPGHPLSIAGIAASPGLAIGVVRVLHAGQLKVPDRPVALGEGGDRLHAALSATRAELNELAAATASRLGKAEAGIFHAQAELLSDTDLITLACQLMVGGHGVEWAWHQAVERMAERLAALGNPLLAARAADLRDVGRRVLRQLDPALNSTTLADIDGDDCILLAADLTPSDTATLDTDRIRALATAQGGPTSHTAILARTLGLPALVAGGPALLDIADGTPAILDGLGGRLYLNPGEQDLASARDWLQTQQRTQQQQAEQRQRPAVTPDGHHVEIAANINRPDQVAAALDAGAEGVGLMRTEFLFLEREQAPSEDEQFHTYSAMLDALDGRPLIVRALDIGGDKQVDYLKLPAEDNPFLGMRGSRLLLRRRDLLEPQLRALYRAARGGQPLSIMFPMITSLKEITRLKGWCEGIRRELDAPAVPLGIMVEVPAAAMLADQLAEYVDFFSIGTNDLTQYTLAMDRQHPELAAEADSLHPAVLRLIQHTVAGASRHQRWVGVCGGIAGDPFGAALLTGLGVAELSMSPRDVAAVKAKLCANGHDRLRELAQQALACDSADEVRMLARELT